MAIKLTVHQRDEPIALNAVFPKVVYDSDIPDYSDDPEDFVITPQADEQVLATKGKKVAEDIVIKAIPFVQTANPTGGVTVYIGP